MEREDTEAVLLGNCFETAWEVLTGGLRVEIALADVVLELVAAVGRVVLGSSVEALEAESLVDDAEGRVDEDATVRDVVQVDTVSSGSDDVDRELNDLVCVFHLEELMVDVAASELLEIELGDLDVIEVMLAALLLDCDAIVLR